MFVKMFEDLWITGFGWQIAVLGEPGHSMAFYLLVKHSLQQWRESGDILGEGDRHCGKPRIATREWSRGFASATLDRKSW